MTARDLIRQLVARGVVLRADGASLVVDAPAGLLTVEEWNDLAQRKVDLLVVLHEDRPVDAGPVVGGRHERCQRCGTAWVILDEAADRILGGCPCGLAVIPGPRRARP